MRKEPWWFFSIGSMDVVYDPVDWPSRAGGQQTVKVKEVQNETKRNANGGGIDPGRSSGRHRMGVKHGGHG
jgi:hypothetical protein